MHLKIVLHPSSTPYVWASNPIAMDDGATEVLQTLCRLQLVAEAIAIVSSKTIKTNQQLFNSPHHSRCRWGYRRNRLLNFIEWRLKRRRCQVEIKSSILLRFYYSNVKRDPTWLFVGHGLFLDHIIRLCYCAIIYNLRGWGGAVPKCSDLLGPRPKFWMLVWFSQQKEHFELSQHNSLAVTSSLFSFFLSQSKICNWNEILFPGRIW